MYTLQLIYALYTNLSFYITLAMFHYIVQG